VLLYSSTASDLFSGNASADELGNTFAQRIGAARGDRGGNRNNSDGSQRGNIPRRWKKTASVSENKEEIEMKGALEALKVIMLVGWSIWFFIAQKLVGGIARNRHMTAGERPAQSVLNFMAKWGNAGGNKFRAGAGQYMKDHHSGSIINHPLLKVLFQGMKYSGGGRRRRRRP
jgi:hypothetical protein